MSTILDYLFGAASFVPHGYCLLWRPDLVALHAVSDAVIALSYFLIPVALFVFLRRRTDIQFSWIIHLFIAFIFLCGATHVAGLVALWWPIYGAQGLIKAATAAVSMTTAFVIWPLIPRLLALPSPASLQAANAEMHKAFGELEALFESAPDATIIVDGDGRIQRANRRTADVFGYSMSELAGLPVENLMPERFRDRHTNNRGQYRSNPKLRQMGSGLQLFGVTRDGSEFPVEISLSPIRFSDEDVVCASIRDVTEERKAQDQLAHAQRIDAIGTLTGGVAHDFNNILSAILANLQLIRRRLPDNEAIAGNLDACLKATRRGADMTSRLLAFARRQPLSPSRMRISELLSDIKSLLATAMPANAALEVSPLEDDDIVVNCDPVQLQAVLLNLISNSADALKDVEHARVWIDVQEVDLIPLPTEIADGIEAGRYVQISVGDNGSGMESATLERVLEPFFTTKQKDSGTGLGLPMVHGFVMQSKGCMRIESAIGAGTIVKLFLPSIGEEPAERRLPESITRLNDPGRNGIDRRKVLVVDDDEDLLPVTVMLLQDIGYGAVGASGIADAMDRLKREGPFDVALCDLYLSNNEDGKQLARQLVNVLPQLKIAFMTGYSPLVHEGKSELQGPLLTKPFGAGELLEVIEGVLSSNERYKNGAHPDRG